MKCSWIKIDKPMRGGTHSLYRCERPGCARHVVVENGRSADDNPGRCRHPMLFEPGEIVHYAARAIGFKECGRCRKRRDAWNNKFSVPVPGWFYKAVRAVVGKRNRGIQEAQTKRVLDMLKRRSALMPALAPIQQAIKEKQAKAAELRKLLAAVTREVSDLKAQMQKVVGEGLSESVPLPTESEGD